MADEKKPAPKTIKAVEEPVKEPIKEPAKTPKPEPEPRLHSTTPKQRLLMKLIAASKMIKAVSKDGNNKFQKYAFQSEGAIKAAVKPALEANGIQVIPSYVVTGERDAGKNHIVDVMGTFIVTDGVAEIVGTMPASGTDTLEKATVKACTSAQKYFYKQLFNISDNDTDPDEGDSTPSYPANNNGYVQPAPVERPSQHAIEVFQQFLADTAMKMGKDQHEVGKAVFAAAGVPVKAYSQMTLDELKRLDGSLVAYTKIQR